MEAHGIRFESCCWLNNLIYYTVLVVADVVNKIFSYVMLIEQDGCRMSTIIILFPVW